jgi:hypothetical protein
MAHVEKQVIKIQAKFRQQLALKRLEKMNEKERAQLERKFRSSQGLSNEELALREFTT